MQLTRVNVEDELELRDVFFGEGSNSGQNYVVLCHSDENSKIPISSVFADASNDNSVPAEFKLVDCEYTLPSSGKTIAERFKLKLKERPTIFISGAIGAPQQVPSKHLKTGKMLVKYLRGKLEVRAAKIETTQDLRSKCLDKDICGLLLKGEKKAPGYLKDAMSKLLKEYPDVSFASVDASVLYVLNLEEHLPELENGKPRFVVFKKVSGSLETGGSRLITSMATLPGNGASYGPMSNLVADVVSSKAEMTKLTSLPVIKTRSKKLEEEERAKRQRKLNQQQRGGTEETPPGAFATNDGSRDGRRAERERRRQEHRKANNVKEKTPEEIAEMERKRRERMEEEAAKWNVAPEDAPPEGEYIMDDEPFDDTTTEVVEDHDDDDDEDVIDLD